ncbi:MAG: chemotaxis response regulator protein-glutamate methylesterase [Verrucomicrobiota bacterium]
MRIAIVNDLPVAAEALRRAVSLPGTHEVAWIASNGREALALCLKDTPDLILMDLIMPKMDGVLTTREIMLQCPCAILVVTCSVEENAEMVFQAMGNGALDAVDTPALGVGDLHKVSAPLLAKIDTLSGMLEGVRECLCRQASSTASPQQEAPPLVVIGASAGGPSALAEILQQLPKDFPSPIIIVQHVDEQFAPSLVEWLKQQCSLPMRGICDGDTPRPGEVLMAVSSKHLILANPRRLKYTSEPKESFYWPSVDVFFESVARHWPGEVVGILLTGMGRDGARGLKTLRNAGFHTITQSKEGCAVYGMPKAAAELGAATEILSLGGIAAALLKCCTHPKSSKTS